MSPALADAIAAAEALAWLPTANLSQPVYEIRHDAAAALVAAIAGVGSLSINAGDELRYLVAAMRRAAAAIYQLRGCLAVWKAAA